ncbi:MAG: hypothetical protein IPP74_14300 [Alphaproteobacteria bacterium]|nr:hypothetical protein [Alphaproteobacteria bacterium]
MLFLHKTKDEIENKLIRVIEAAVYSLQVLGENEINKDIGVEEAYKELSEAMADIVDSTVLLHSEYHYILYRAKLKYNILIAKQ